MAGKAKKQVWLSTLIDVQQVFTLSEDKTQILLGGKPLSDTQMIQLKSEAEVIDKLYMWPILIETVRQQAITAGFNKAEDFEAVTAAKGILFVTDWMRSWTTAIKSVKIKSEVPRKT